MTNNRKYQDPFRGYRRSQSNAVDAVGVMEPQIDESTGMPHGMGSLMDSDVALVADVLPPTAVPSPMGAALQGLMGSGPVPSAEAKPAPAVKVAAETVAVAPPAEPAPMAKPAEGAAPGAPVAGKSKAGLAGVLAWLRTPE